MKKLVLLFRTLMLVVLLGMSILSCGGGGEDSGPPPNTGGGYTLKVSGGTLNDGSGVNGLVVLATLRAVDGSGPGAAGWTISITGPGISDPLVVDYDDGSSSSYMTWWWEEFDPQSGTYTASATDGLTTLNYTFTIDTTQSLPSFLLNKTGDTISWSPLANAGSYYYRVTDGMGNPVDWNYRAADQTSFPLDAYLPDGSYLIEVFAHTKNRYDLMTDPSDSPSLPSQEDMSLARLDFVKGGSGSGYTLDVRGGVLYEGEYPAGTHYYGLVIWASILTNTASPLPPAGDWTVSVTGPGISSIEPVVFIYPGSYSHYVWWDFGAVPASGTSYTVTAVSPGGTEITQTFTIPDPVTQLPVATGLTAAAANGGGATVSWDPVSGAGSYYVNIWTYVGEVYTEIAGRWVSSTSAIIPNGTLSAGVSYDAYVTACQLDMTDMESVPLPVAPGAQVDMSDTTFTYETFTAL